VSTHALRGSLRLVPPGRGNSVPRPPPRATVEDYHHRCFLSTYAAHLAAGSFEPPDRVGTRQQLRDWFSPGSDCETVVAVDGETPIGHVTVSGHRLVHLFVEPGHQGRGLGRSCSPAARRCSVRAATPKLELHARVENAAAIAFYVSHGWTVTDRLIHTVEHGISYDERVLVKRIP